MVLSDQHDSCLNKPMNESVGLYLLPLFLLPSTTGGYIFSLSVYVGGGREGYPRPGQVTLPPLPWRVQGYPSLPPMQPGQEYLALLSSSFLPPARKGLIFVQIDQWVERWVLTDQCDSCFNKSMAESVGTYYLRDSYLNESLNGSVDPYWLACFFKFIKEWTCVFLLTSVISVWINHWVVLWFLTDQWDSWSHRSNLGCQ